MVEVIEFVWEHRHEPIGWVLLGSFLVAIDRLSRRLITHQVKRLFRIGDKNDFQGFARNQQIIMENQRRLMKHLGVEPWNVGNEHLSAGFRLQSPQFSYKGKSLALLVDAYTRLQGTVKYLSKGVNRLSKTWLVGLLGYVAYFIKQSTGFNVPDEMINSVAEIILLLIPLIAMFANMKRGDATGEKYPMDDGPAV